MVRAAVEEDRQALIRLRCARSGGTEEDAAGWLCKVAGLDNILVVQPAERPPAAMLGAVPVRCGERRGIWFCGAAAADGVPLETLLPRLLESCLRAFSAKGYDFAVLTPDSAAEAARLEKLGFQNLLPTRVLKKPIRRNLMAHAEFDSLTVRGWLEMRQRYQPGCVNLPEPAMNEVMAQLYRHGLTIVSNRRGYGLYFTKGDRLQFLELQADQDYCADLLLQAAREKTGAEQAQVLLAENQALYLGAGRRCGYGMIAFLRGEFPITDVYFRMLL